MLSVQEYDQTEQQAADDLPCRVVEMVNPMTFASEGYPVRIRHERALWRYLDVMHETRFDNDFNTLHAGGLTAPEFDYLKAIATQAHTFARNTFDRSLTTRGSLSRSLHIFRSIIEVAGETPQRVFEIGPGSGYLGSLFIKKGWGYGATDIAQAFYLLQNRLWKDASNSQLIELVTMAKTWSGEISSGHPVHVPWWEFFRFMERTPPAVDIVTCNHALAEMHPNSLAFTLRVAHRMLRGEGLKLFIFEGWGFEKHNAREKVVKQFLDSGFMLVHSDDWITIFAPRSCLENPKSLIVPGGTIKPHVQPGRSVFIPGNHLTERIIKARADRKLRLTVTLQQVNSFYQELLGSPDLRTADERFLDTIGRGY